jgi:hypothetical protein
MNAGPLPQAITLARLRVELLFGADAATLATWQNCAVESAPQSAWSQQ